MNKNESKSFITTDTIYAAAAKDRRVVTRPGDIITPEARELAKNKGVRFVSVAADSPRIPVIAANWKMNIPQNIDAYLEALCSFSRRFENTEIILCPPAPYLQKVSEKTSQTTVATGSQNIYHAEKGAYTGELSCGMLKEFGARYAIIGHSERRALFSETDAEISKKLQFCLKQEIIPILCIGEDLATNKAGKTLSHVAAQIFADLEGCSPEQAAQVIIAYEPIWAIGTGLTPKTEEIQFTHAAIRELVKHKFSSASKQVRILYGGSVNDKNAREILCCEDVDGCLVGGASLESDKFIKIIESLS